MTARALRLEPFVPVGAGVYALVEPEAPDVWVYVGATGCLQQRAVDHALDTGSGGRTPLARLKYHRWLRGLPPLELVVLETCPDKESAHGKEAGWITRGLADAHPLLNVLNRRKAP
jgi:hypothetical protein